MQVDCTVFLQYSFPFGSMVLYLASFAALDLRQENPLSLLLLLVIMEALSRTLTMDVERGLDSNQVFWPIMEIGGDALYHISFSLMVH